MECRFAYGCQMLTSRLSVRRRRCAPGRRFLRLEVLALGLLALLPPGCPGSGTGGPDVWSNGDTIVVWDKSCAPCPPSSYGASECPLLTPGGKLHSDCSACLRNSKGDLGICATCTEGTLVLDPQESESVEQAIGTESGTVLLTVVVEPDTLEVRDAPWKAVAVRLRRIGSDLSVTSTVDVLVPDLPAPGGPEAVGPRGVAACGNGVVGLASWSSQGLFVALVPQDGAVVSDTLDLPATHVHDVYASPEEGDGFLVLTSESDTGGELYVTKIGCDLLPEWSQNEPLCEGCTNFDLPNAWRICGREAEGTVIAGTRQEFDFEFSRKRRYAAVAFLNEYGMPGGEVWFGYTPEWTWPQTESFAAACWFASGKGFLAARMCDTERPDRCWPFMSELEYHPGPVDDQLCESSPADCAGSVWESGSQFILDSEEPVWVGAALPLPGGARCAVAGTGPDGLSLQVLRFPDSGWPERSYIEDLVPFKPGQCTQPVMARASAGGGDYVIGLGCGGDYASPERDRVLVTRVRADCITVDE